MAASEAVQADGATPAKEMEPCSRRGDLMERRISSGVCQVHEQKHWHCPSSRGMQA